MPLQDRIHAKSKAVDAIEKLYERGVFDHVSVSLWCDYLNFVQNINFFQLQDKIQNINFFQLQDRSYATAM
jgi:hypothetical protein